MRLGQQPNGIGHRRKYNTPHSCIAPGCIRGFHMLVRRSARWSHCCYCRHCCRCRCCLRPMSLQCGDTSTSARQSLTRSRLANVPSTQCERQLARASFAWQARRRAGKQGYAARRGAREHVAQHMAAACCSWQSPAALTSAQLLRFPPVDELTCAAVASEHAPPLPLPLEPLLLLPSLLPLPLPLLPPPDVPAVQRHKHECTSVAHTLAVGGCSTQCERQLAWTSFACPASATRQKSGRSLAQCACVRLGRSPSPTEISLKSVVFVLSLLNESESRRQVCYAKAINM